MQIAHALAEKPDVIVRRYTLCGACALWLPLREDSIAPDYGLCPRRKYPDNRTHCNDGCRKGVLPKE